MSQAADPEDLADEAELVSLTYGPAFFGLTYRFADKAVEQRFWLAMMPQGRRRLIILCWAALLICLPHLPAHLASLFSDTGSHPKMAAQCFQATVCLATLLALRRPGSPRTLELLGAVFGTSYIATRCLLLEYMAPEGSAAMVVGSIALMLFCLPARLTFLAPAMAGASALMLVIWSEGMPHPTRGAVAQVGEWLIVVNLLGMTALRMMGLTLRRQFALGQALRHLATHDGLTGIANRRRHDQFLTQEWTRCQAEGLPLSLVLLDVDFFKLLNDSIGHEAGDDCLRDLARLLVRSVKVPTALVARTGGEEFTCVLPGVSPQDALMVAHGITAVLGAAAMAHPHSPIGPHITVSQGVATAYPAQGLTVRDLTGLADRLVYEAKAEGRACVRQQVLAGTQARSGELLVC